MPKPDKQLESLIVEIIKDWRLNHEAVINHLDKAKYGLNLALNELEEAAQKLKLSGDPIKKTAADKLYNEVAKDISSKVFAVIEMRERISWDTDFSAVNNTYNTAGTGADKQIKKSIRGKKKDFSKQDKFQNPTKGKKK